jgi:L-asparaginase II
MQPMSENPYVPLFELTRGETVESTHFGAIAVVDVAGKLVASCGDPYGVAFLRSSAKPFQALPFIEAGGHKRLDLTSKEIALMCASHAGTDEHVRVVETIQAKTGIAEKNLKCGVHPVFHKETAEAMRERGEEPTPNRHNCSGKHSGMLAHARMKSLTLEDYLENNHEVQQSILKTFAEMCGMSPEEVRLGIDGCSAPNFAAPLYNVAWGWAQLAAPHKLSQERAAACQTIIEAMTSHPEMVGGPARFDTVLMEVAGGRIVAKGGAEAYQCMALMPGAVGDDSPALGVAFKISDGDSRGRARSGVAVEILRQLGALSQDDLDALAAFGPSGDVLNWRKLVVGEKRPIFTLNKN